MNEQNSILKFMIILRCVLYGMASRHRDILIDKIEVVVNETAFINCIVNASVDIQWHFNSIFNYVYAGGGIKVPYLGRLRMENDGANMNTLVIPMVAPKDVGWYYCSEEETGRRFTATYLTVLYSRPVCYSNMKPEGFIGSKTCCNFDQNYMIFNCAVSFKGEPPHLTWSSLNDSKPLNVSIVCDDQHNRRNCSITLKPDLSYDGSIFICQIESTNGIGHKCSTEVIKVLYFLVHHDFTERKVHENVSCPVRSNLNVGYKWTLKQDNKNTLLSSNQMVSIQNPGIYQCEVEYNIRNASCFLVASVVRAVIESRNITTTPDPAFSGTAALAIIFSIGFVFVVLCTGMFILIRKRRKRKRENRRENEIRKEYERRENEIRENEIRENERIRNKIKGMYKDFVLEVDPRDVLHPLIQRNIISKTDGDNVLNKETMVDGCRALLELLFSSSHRETFIVLKEALRWYYPMTFARIDATDNSHVTTIQENEIIKDKVVSMYIDFTSEVDPKNIFDHLIQSRIISTEEKQRVMNTDTAKERCRALVDHLFLCSKENAFIILRGALKDCYPKIVERIDASDEDNEAECMTIAGKQENERIRNRVVAIYEDFVLEVDPKKVVDFLIQNKSVNVKQIHHLKNQVKTEDQCKALLDLLISCSKDNAFIILKEALKEHYPGIVERIDSPSTGDERSTVRVKSSIIVFGKKCNIYNAIKINLNRPDEISVLQQLPFKEHIDQQFLYMAATVYCGSVFVTGIGEDEDEIWRFDARYSKWNKCASMIKGRSYHSVAFVDHILYICGGRRSSYEVFDGVEAYDAIDDKCSVVGKLTYAVYSAGNCVPYKASLYIFGGKNARKQIVNSVQVYNTKLNSCTVLTNPMPRSEAYLSAALFKKYVILLGDESCFLYNVDTETWEVRDQFNTDVECFGMTVHNEKLFVIGGILESIRRDDVRYVPIANILNNEPIEWRHYAKLPESCEAIAFGKLEFLVKEI